MIKKLPKTAACAYLYADGHLIFKHERTDKRSIKTDWVTRHPASEVNIECAFTGRLIFSEYNLAPLLVARKITVHEHDVMQGSDKTKALNISIGHIYIHLAPKTDVYASTTITIQRMPDLLCDGFIHQPFTDEKWEDIEHLYYWGSCQIA